MTFSKKRSHIPIKVILRLMGHLWEIGSLPILIVSLEVFIYFELFWSILKGLVWEVYLLLMMVGNVLSKIMSDQIGNKLWRKFTKIMLKVGKHSFINLLSLKHLWYFWHFIWPIMISKIQWKLTLSQFSTCNEQLDCWLLIIRWSHAFV